MDSKLFPLCELLQDFYPALEWGTQNLIKTSISSHKKITYITALKDANNLTHYHWTKGPITAHKTIQTLTPALKYAMINGKLRENLKQKGYTQPIHAWNAYFETFYKTTQ